MGGPIKIPFAAFCRPGEFDRHLLGVFLKKKLQVKNFAEMVDIWHWLSVLGAKL